MVKKSVKNTNESAEKPVELIINDGVINKVESGDTSVPESTSGPAVEVPPVEKIDLEREPIKGAIDQGLVLIREGKSKADAARAIFGVIKDEPKEVIVAAFVAGATLTEKGALTYWYNCKRKAKKEASANS